MHLPTLITDLAIMLLTAGVITILFKKFRQPLVLGYILAGFLISPYMPLLPTVMDMESIGTWSEIGIIVLMFYLGLEFNLHKLAKVGGTAIITAIVEVAGMLVLGFAVGQLLGWSILNSIFLGGMLSMSSTTIIIKAFDELNLRGKKFTELVFGTLVIEDIAGIFMMVLLSTIAVSQNISGSTLALDIVLLLFYLALWLMLGIYLLPTLLKYASKLMNDETLLVVSLGICFGMVLLANALGFSSALGAFLAGSLLAGTIHAERVEHLTKGVRDLFGAVFFLSVGMMVNPAVLGQYIGPILLITVVTLIGKLFFSSAGMLLSGQPLGNSLRCGFSLAQIGEFAFIIASLGLSLGVISDFLYPIVVSVSVITTFTTPFFMKSADKATGFLEKRLPQRMLEVINRYSDEEQSDKEQDSDWYSFIKRFFKTTCLYGVVMVGITFLGLKLLLPFLAEYLPVTAAQIMTLLVIYIGIALFIRPMLDYYNEYYIALWLKSRSFRLPLLVFTWVRVALIAVIALAPFQYMWRIHAFWMLPLVALVVVIVARSRFLATFYLQVESRFLANFNERLLQRDNRDKGDYTWLDEQLYMESFTCPAEASYLNKSLQDLNWGHYYDVTVVKIIRGNKHINIPTGKERLHKGDQVFLLGDEKPLKNIAFVLGITPLDFPQTLRSFMLAQEEDKAHALYCCAVQVTEETPFANKPIRDSGIREEWDCLLLGLQHNHYPMMQPDVNTLIAKGDLIWVLGSNKMVGQLVQNNLFNSNIFAENKHFEGSNILQNLES